MRTNRMLLVGALGVMLGALPIQSAFGQFFTPWTGPRPVEGGRTALEAFYTRVGVDAGGQTMRAGGVGGRLLWALDPAAGASSALPASVARRTALGVFGAYTPETRGVSTGQIGLAADVTPLARPLAGRIEPFVSLGAGALHTSVRTERAVVLPSARPLMDRDLLGARAIAAGATGTTAFMLAPSAGARVQVRPGVAVQGDVRRLVTFDHGPRQHSAFGTGLRLTF